MRSLREAVDAGVERTVVREHGDEPDFLTHAPPADHVARDQSQLVDVVLSPCRLVAEHDLLCGAATQSDLDPRLELLLRVIEAIDVGGRERDTECRAARNDRHLADRIGAAHEHADQSVAGFVVRRPAAVRVGHHHLALGAEHDLLERVSEVLVEDSLAVAASRQQRRLVDEVREICPDHPRRGRRETTEVDLRC